MHLYQRGSKWWCSWTENGVTVRKTTGCTTKEAATLWAKRLEREQADPVYAAKKAAEFITESGIFLDTIRARKNVPVGTVNMYQCKIGHLNRLMPERMYQIDAVAIDKYFFTRRAEHASGSTLHKEWVALRGVLKSAARRNRWSGDLETLKPDWISPKSEEKDRRLTWLELEALLGHLDDELGDLVRFAVATGARRVELGRALEGDADGLTHFVRIRGSKTAASDATIPIPGIFVHLVPQRAWLVRCKPVDHKPAKLFPRVPENLRCLNAACRKARIKPVSYNDLRRTFSSLLIEAGASNTVVAKLLRHESTAMVDKHYGKPSDLALADLIRRQTSVRGLYQRDEKATQTVEALEPKPREFVGHDRIELSTNGLRALWDLANSTAIARVPDSGVRRLYQTPKLMRLLEIDPGAARALTEESK